MVAVIGSAPAQAQETAPWYGDPSAQVALIGRDAGLPNTNVFDVLRDRVGFVWAATGSGLYRWDGLAFEPYRHDPADPGSLSSSTVRRLHEDRRGRLWVRTEVGLDRLDPGGGFRRYPLRGALLVDGPDGTLWAAAPGGLHRFDESADSFALARPFPTAPEPDEAWSVFVDGAGSIWVGTRLGRLLHFDAGGRFLNAVTAPWGKIALGHRDEFGRLWFGHESGLGAFDPRTASFHDALELGVRVPAPGPFHAILPELGGAWWAAGDAGVFRIYPQGLVQRMWRLDGPMGPLANTVLSARRDAWGGTWMGSLRGVLHFDPYRKPFQRRTVPDLPGGDGPWAGTLAVAEDASGALWLGSLASGVARVDPRTGAVERRGLGARPPAVWAVLPAPDGTVWLGTGAGLYSTTPGGATRHHALRGAPEAIVFTLARDSLGGLWIGTSTGLLHAPPGLDVARARDVPLNGPPPVRVEGLRVSAEGTVWVGTSRGEVRAIDPATGTTRSWSVGASGDLEGTEGLWALQPDPQGRVWLGSDRGVHVLDPRNGLVHALPRLGGRWGGAAYRLEEDGQGYIWATTDRGIVRIEPPGERWTDPVARRYDAADGVSEIEFNRRAGARTRSGHVVFGGMAGLTIFDPGRILDDPNPPPVALTAVDRLTRDGPAPWLVAPGDTLRLRAGDRGFTVSFAALSFTNSANNRFAYRLEGYEEAWTDPGSLRQARYAGVSPGRYRLVVRAANADGTWNLEGAALPVVVTPPVWARGWFLLLAAVLALGASAQAARKLSHRRLRRRIHELEVAQRVQEERARISRDLHDHIGSHVATLVSGIELARLSTSQGRAAEADEHLAAVHREARGTLAELRETVWSLHEEAPTLEGFRDRVEGFLERRTRFDPELQATLDVRGPPDRTLSPAEALNLFRIIQEAVNNAIQHGGATRIDLGMVVEAVADGALRLSIADNGTGPAVGTAEGMGIAGLRQRAASLGGTARIRRNPGGGTLVEIALPHARAARE